MVATLAQQLYTIIDGVNSPDCTDQCETIQSKAKPFLCR